MRNTGKNGKNSDGLVAVVLRMLVAALAIGLVAGAMSLFAAPARALAAVYEYSNAKIDAQVETDGDLRVSDQRILDYSADSNEYVQEIAKLDDNQLVVINSIRVAPVDSQGNVVGDWTKLSPVAFKPEWRRGVSGSQLDQLLEAGSYSYDMVKYTVHLYYRAKAGDRVVLDLDYSIVNGAVAYKDVGEVKLKYVGESFAADSRNVVFTLSLPVPEGGKAVPDTNVYAWGHGPANGVVDNQGQTIVFTDDYVKAGQYAEAHVLFPSSWLTNITGAGSRLHKDQMHLSSVLTSEAKWQDSFRYGAIVDDRISLVIGVVCALVLAAALLVYRRFGRDPEATAVVGAADARAAAVLERAEQSGAVADVADAAGMREGAVTATDDASIAAGAGQRALRRLHPAMAVRFLNDGVPSDGEVAATALRLCEQGLLAISPDLHVERRSFDMAEDPIDAAAMGVFEALAGGSVVVDLRGADAAQSLCGRKEEFLSAVRAWDDATRDAYRALGFVSESSMKWVRRLRRVAIVLLFAALFVLVGTTCYLAAAILVLTALGVLGVSCETRACTQEAANVLTCIDAYREELLSAGEFSRERQFDAYLLGLMWDERDVAGVLGAAVDGAARGAVAADALSLAEAVEGAIPAVFTQVHKPASDFSSRISARAKRFFAIVKQKGKKQQVSSASQPADVE